MLLATHNRDMIAMIQDTFKEQLMEYQSEKKQQHLIDQPEYKDTAYLIHLQCIRQPLGNLCQNDASKLAFIGSHYVSVWRPVHIIDDPERYPFFLLIFFFLILLLLYDICMHLFFIMTIAQIIGLALRSIHTICRVIGQFVSWLLIHALIVWQLQALLDLLCIIGKEVIGSLVFCLFVM